MNFVTVLFFVSVVCGGSRAGLLRRIYPAVNQVPLQSSDDPGEPLFLTPYIKAQKINQAQKLAAVKGLGVDIQSYAGYLTVQEKYQSNLYFWYFPAAKNAESAPVVLWLQGGPGGSSLYGLFTENGPLVVDKNMKLSLRQYSWSHSYNLLYIDNPVGTGYSFTKSDKGYARNQTDVARDLYEGLTQFFTLFPNLQKNDFYVTGESYAGKYVPAISYKIHTENSKGAKLQINFKGMAIGDGLCDPYTQMNYGDYLYNIGLLNDQERWFVHRAEQNTQNFIREEKWLEAFKVWDDVLNGDLSGHPSFFTNATGFNFYFNFLLTRSPEDQEYYGTYVQRADVRRAIHVGNLTYNSGEEVEEHLVLDMMQSTKPWVEGILDANYKVLLYSGQLDIIVAQTLTQNFIRNLLWKGRAGYEATKKRVWRVGEDVAGYATSYENFSYVIVRNAGHMVPYDQPKFAYDMISRFISGKPF